MKHCVSEIYVYVQKIISANSVIVSLKNILRYSYLKYYICVTVLCSIKYVIIVLNRMCIHNELFFYSNPIIERYICSVYLIFN